MRLLFTILIIPLFSLSQTFEKVFTNNIFQIATDAIECSEGYLISTRVADNNKKAYAMLSLYNKQGNEMRSCKFDKNGSNVIENIILVNDTLVFVVINQLEPNSDSSKLVYHLLNLDFETIKSKEIQTRVPRSSNDLAITVASKICFNIKGNLIHAFGYQDLADNKEGGYYLNKINPITLEHTSNYYNDLGHDALPQSITPYAKTDSLLLFFSTKTYMANNEQNIVDTLPDELIIHSTDTSYYIMWKHITADWIDNKLVLGGNISTLLFAQFNSDLSVKTVRTFGNYDNDRRCSAFNKCLSVNKNSIYFGGSGNYSSFLYGYESTVNIVKLDRNIDLIWDKEYKKDDGYYYYAMNILATSDGGCLVAATRNNQETQGNKLDMYLLKVDSLGNYTPSSIHQSLIEKQNICVYPNPGSNTINFKLPSGVTIAQFNLYDISGKKVLTRTTEFEQNTIQTTVLQKGIYIYEIWNSAKLIGRGKWIKN